jgi:hypothetical protein
MDHPEATRLMAAEKYLLNELSPELRKSFEEHLFECPECEFDVQAGYALIDGSKEVLSSKAVEVAQARVPGKPNQWLAWLRPAIAVPVMAVLLVVIGYQNLVTVPTLKNAVAAVQVPQILKPVYLTVGGNRGLDQAVTIQHGHPLPLTLDLATENGYGSLVCELQSPTGEIEGSLPISAGSADAVTVLMPLRHGVSGVYQVVIYGISGSQRVEIERRLLNLQIQ